MGIGLIKAEVENLFEEIIEKAFGGALQVHICREQAINVIQGDAVNIVHDQDMAMRQVPVDLWREDKRIVCEVLREAGHVGRFQDKIELLVNGIGELLHHLHGIERPAFRKIFFHQRGEHAQHHHVRGDHLIDALTLDFLITTSPPDLSVARWIWPMLAEAKGSGWMTRKGESGPV